MLSLKTALTQIAARLGAEADYIVERGSYQESSVRSWNWTKYASGRMHVDCLFYASYQAASQYGNGYYTDYSITVPNVANVPVLDDTITNIIISWQEGNGIFWFDVGSTSGRIIKYRASNAVKTTTSINGTVLYAFDARWKSGGGHKIRAWLRVLCGEEVAPCYL